jgi:membrane protein insertase Oxa1/YidC/SpoIIIJ
MPLASIPIYITMFCALRRLVIRIPEELSTGGLLWLTDLTVHDPMFPWMAGLPVICVVLVDFRNVCRGGFFELALLHMFLIVLIVIILIVSQLLFKII